MGISPREWGEMRPCDFWAAYKAHIERDDAMMAYWSDIARVAVFRIIGPWLKNAPRKADQFWPLPWDRKKAQDDLPRGDARKEQIKKLIAQVNGIQP